MSAICYVTSGGVAERFPGAKFMFLEANGGWLVPWLERLDHHAKKFSWDVPWLKMLPSEYFRRQCWISFDPDESMLAFTANSPLCGADRIIWASDYPHPDAKFPGVTEELDRSAGGTHRTSSSARSRARAPSRCTASADAVLFRALLPSIRQLRAICGTEVTDARRYSQRSRHGSPGISSTSRRSMSQRPPDLTNASR